MYQQQFLVFAGYEVENCLTSSSKANRPSNSLNLLRRQITRMRHEAHIDSPPSLEPRHIFSSKAVSHGPNARDIELSAHVCDSGGDDGFDIGERVAGGPRGEVEQRFGVGGIDCVAAEVVRHDYGVGFGEGVGEAGSWEGWS